MPAPGGLVINVGCLTFGCLILKQLFSVPHNFYGQKRIATKEKYFYVDVTRLCEGFPKIAAGFETENN